MADGDLYLSDSPNVDKGFVEQDGQLRRTVLTAVPEGTLQLSDSANASTGYVTDSDGKKHKVNLVATVDGTLELPENAASDSGYVVDGDGKRHRVKLTASLHGGGSAPIIDELNVTPSTSAQTITAPSGTDGYSPVNVSAVTSAIDANITAGNIKDGVSILGVTGNYQGNIPTGTKSITANGVYDVTNYASADVQVPTTAPESYRAFRVDNYGTLKNSVSTPWVPLPAGTTDIESYLFYHAYMSTPANILNGAIDLSSLIEIDGTECCNGMFDGCTGITSVDMGSVQRIIGHAACQGMFLNCSGLTIINLSSLTRIDGGSNCYNMFRYCTGLTSVDLSSLTKISSSAYDSTCCYGMFYGCTGLTSIDLSSLTGLYGQNSCQYMFYGCINLLSLSFPSLKINSFSSTTNQFNNMLSGVTGCTVHFPSNIQSKIGSWSDVTNGFGGTNTTVLFDLPATNTLTGADTNTYSRNPKYDTATALAWKVGAYGTTNFTPAYYTSGTTDPVVSDTIYSDSACTTPVTTISSIA